MSSCPANSERSHGLDGAAGTSIPISPMILRSACVLGIHASDRLGGVSASSVGVVEVSHGCVRLPENLESGERSSDLSSRPGTRCSVSSERPSLDLPAIGDPRGPGSIKELARPLPARPVGNIISGAQAELGSSREALLASSADGVPPGSDPA